jgi:hypothetical protein
MENLSLTEKLGGLKANFSILYNGEMLNTDAPILVHYPIYQHDQELYKGGYGYAYQALHLEFLSFKNIESKKYTFEFFDKTNTLQWKIPYYPIIKTHQNIDKTKFLHSINIENIPILVLENTSKINFSDK